MITPHPNFFIGQLMMRYLFVLLCVLSKLILTSHRSAQAEAPIELRVSSEYSMHANDIVRIPAPEKRLQNEPSVLIRKEDGKSIPVQVDRYDETAQLVWILEEPLDAGRTRDYVLHSVEQPHGEKIAQVRIADDGKHVLASIENRPILQYNHALVESPLKNQPYYARSGYIHPVYLPSGELITDDFNPDHGPSARNYVCLAANEI